MPSLFRCLCLLVLVTDFAFFQPVHGQDRETLTRICDEYTAQNRSIRVGVLAKGETSFPFSNWRGVFEGIENSFLGRVGCKTHMTLYSVPDMATNVSAGNVDIIFSNPLQGAQFEVLYGAKVFVSLTQQYTSPWNGRLPFPGATASLDRFAAVMMYAHANMTKGLGNATVPNWLVQRRASIDVFAPQTYEDVIAMLPHFPKKNFTMCVVSLTGFGGFGMINYEFTKRGVVMSNNFNFIVGKSHADCIDKVLSGVADFTNIRTGQLEVYVNDTRIDPGTFTVINNAPTKFFPLFCSTPLYPEWPVLAMPWVDAALVQTFSVPLTALSILTNTPESLAVSGASFSYPFSYDSVKSLMFDTNVMGDGSCAIGWARRLPTDPFPLDPTVPHPCFACGAGTYVVTANGTSTCTSCPLNTYNEGSGQNCTACTTGLITNSVGATSSDQCVEPTKQIVAMSTSASNAILGICIACLGLLLICGLVVVALHANPVMKAASPVFLILALLGLGLLCASTIPRALENVNTNFESRFNPPSSMSCDADIWLANLGYTLVTSALLVKTWRLYSIFTSRQLAGRNPLTDGKLSLVVLGLLLCQCAIILGLTQSWPMSMGIYSYDNKSDYFTCSLGVDAKYSLQSLYLPVIMVPRFALLIATTVAAFLVRNLPAAYNESSQLLYTMYNLSFFSVLLPAIDVAVGRGKDSGLIAYSVSVFLICFLTAVILFTPKFLLILRGRVPIQGPSALDTKTTTTSSGDLPMAPTTGNTNGRVPKGAMTASKTPSNGLPKPLPKTNLPKSTPSHGGSHGSPSITAEGHTGTQTPNTNGGSISPDQTNKRLPSQVSGVTSKQVDLDAVVIEMNQLESSPAISSTNEPPTRTITVDANPQLSQGPSSSGDAPDATNAPAQSNQLPLSSPAIVTSSPSATTETTTPGVTIHLE